MRLVFLNRLPQFVYERSLDQFPTAFVPCLSALCARSGCPAHWIIDAVMFKVATGVRGGLYLSCVPLRSFAFLGTLIVASFLNAAYPVVANKSTPRLDSRIARIDAKMTEIERKGFSGLLLIKKGDGTLLEKGYGVADCKSRPVQLTDVFDVGSITKDFTAVAILKLQALNKLSLDDRLSKYFSEVPPDKAGITIEQLLRHSSGLPESLGEDENYVSREWLLAHAFAAPLLFKPGEGSQYSNVAYSMAAAIIEKVSGMRYENFMRDYLFVPSNMKNTGYFLPQWAKRKLACGMRDGKRWGSVADYFGPQEPSWYLVGNGGTLSTGSDLDRWFSAIRANRILPTQLTDLYLEAITRVDRTGRKYISTSGSNLVFTSQYLRWIDNDLTVILLTNNSEWPKEKVLPLLREDLQGIR